MPSAYSPGDRTLRTTLTGNVSLADVIAWRNGLLRAEADIPNGAAFKLLLDLRGFETSDMEAHKAMRNVVPELLARHGMRPAFLDLFPELPEITITTERGARCIAFANVHHDAEKMAKYDTRIGKVDQRFFTDPRAAERWLADRG